MLARKAEAFCWRVRTIDGHAPDEIMAALGDADGDRPLCIIARTVKGWGVPLLGGMGHHGTAVPDAKVEEVIDALDAKARELGADRMADEAPCMRHGFIRPSTDSYLIMLRLVIHLPYRPPGS